MGSLSQFVLHLAARGQFHFTTEEARAALGVSLPAVRAALRRLKRRGELADPHRGFHLIVPPEYRRLGCLPPEQFVPQLMAHLNEFYYVALLSAAEFHGAAHQRPQTFQVMVRKNRRPLACGGVRVQFVARKDLELTPTVEKNSPRGTVRISSPEATALELVGYAEHCGGLDSVATVVADLTEVMDAARMIEAARLCPISWVQRLGYLLEQTEPGQIAEPLVEYVKLHAPALTPLVRKNPLARAIRLERWRLAVNGEVTPDQ